MCVCGVCVCGYAIFIYIPKGWEILPPQEKVEIIFIFIIITNPQAKEAKTLNNLIELVINLQCKADAVGLFKWGSKMAMRMQGDAQDVWR